MPTDNPLLQYQALPRFDCILPEHAQPAIETILAYAEPSLAKIEQSVTPTWKGAILPLRKLLEPLDFAWGVITHLHSVMNTTEWRTAHDALQPSVIAFSLRVNQSDSIYKALKTLRSGTAWSTLDETQQRIVAASLLDAELAGVGLPNEKRERFNTIKRELALTSTQFSNNVLDATKAFALNLQTQADIAGLPKSLLAAASEAAKLAGSETSTAEIGPWVITLEAPLFVPFMQYSTQRDHRETLYRAFVTRASSGDGDNTPLIDTTLKLRREMAEILGYTTYAEVSLAQKMADSPSAVDAMIERLHSVAAPAAQRELEELRRYAAQHGETKTLMNWDVAFWSDHMRETLFEFTDEDLRPYFQFPRVLEGLFDLAHNLFGITIAPPESEIPVWHEDVRPFTIKDASGADMATFYLDPYSRPATKRGGAWMNALRPRQQTPDGKITLPVATMVCNQTRPSNDKPSLMTFNEVTTLFHEFGHTLQHLLTTVNEPEAAGIHNVEWDAVELPSQFMENWCYHRPTLIRMSEHIDTGEPLPEALYQKLYRARTFLAGSSTMRQLLFAALDLELHHRYRADGTLTPDDVKRCIGSKFSLMPFIEQDRFLCGFSHIFAGGYAAGYYSYKWAEVLSADAFGAFVEAGLNDNDAIIQTGQRFRDTILAAGGSLHPMDVFKSFRGREPDPNTLLRHQGLLEKEG